MIHFPTLGMQRRATAKVACSSRIRRRKRFISGTYFHKDKEIVRIFVCMKREIWLDFLRVTACFLVMTVHATEPFYLGGDGTLVLSSAVLKQAVFNV